MAEEALILAREVILVMLAKRPDVRDAMIEHKARVGIMAETEVTTDIPEHRHLANDPNTDWDTGARGLSGTPQNPITTAGEENLLCFSSDVYAGESILVHEFAHAIHLMGIKFVEPDFEDRLEQTYQNAKSSGLWNNTYAQTNRVEYWAEGVQSWFNTNQKPQNGIHNEIDTRRELITYDPELYALVSSYFPDNDWKAPCE